MFNWILMIFAMLFIVIRKRIFLSENYHIILFIFVLKINLFLFFIIIFMWFFYVLSWYTMTIGWLLFSSIVFFFFLNLTFIIIIVCLLPSSLHYLCLFLFFYFFFFFPLCLHIFSCFSFSFPDRLKFFNKRKEIIFRQLESFIIKSNILTNSIHLNFFIFRYLPILSSCVVIQLNR